MATDRQIAANRSNAKKSTGPRSKAGREVSRGNAQRHGLAIDIGADPAFHDDIEKLAQLLSNGSGMNDVIARAREAAEAQLDLSRIRKIRAWLLETLYFADIANSDRLTELNDKLAKLERYERRAFSRRKRALRTEFGLMRVSEAR
jgi:hypothetical protein